MGLTRPICSRLQRIYLRVAHLYYVVVWRNSLLALNVVYRYGAYEVLF